MRVGVLHIICPRKWHRWLVAVVVAVLALCGYLAAAFHQAARQRQVVATIRKSGGWVFYNCHYAQSGLLARSKVPGPGWLQSLVGADLLGRVDGVLLTDHSELEGLLNLDLPFRPKVRFSDQDMALLKCLDDLDWLALSDMPIGDRGLRHLENLTELERLWLDGTQVTDAGLGHLSQLRRLRSLWLDRTRVTDRGLGRLASLSRLELLSLTETAVTDAGLVQLASLKKLRELRLRGTRCTLSGVLHLFALQGRTFREALEAVAHPVLDDQGHVLSLDLSRLSTTDRDLDHLTGLERLEWLFLRGTRITDAGLEKLTSLRSLTLLDLSDTQISDAGLQHLAGLPKLRTLHLAGTRATDEGVRRLQSALPETTRIYRISFGQRP